MKSIQVKTFSGMYFSCIMFMVSSSCIVTILILNYHHRYDHPHHHDHDLPDQAGGHSRDAGVGAGRLPPVDALAPAHVQVIKTGQICRFIK